MNDLVHVITDANFDAEVAASTVPVFLEFGAVWCPPCRAMEPHVAALAARYAGRVHFGGCDVDVNYAVATRLRVQAAPTFIVLVDGVVVDRVVGAVPRARLEAMIEPLVRSAPVSLAARQP